MEYLFETFSYKSAYWKVLEGLLCNEWTKYVTKAMYYQHYVVNFLLVN